MLVFLFVHVHWRKARKTAKSKGLTPRHMSNNQICLFVFGWVRNDWLSVQSVSCMYPLHFSLPSSAQHWQSALLPVLSYQHAGSPSSYCITLSLRRICLPLFVGSCLLQPHTCCLFVIAQLPTVTVLYYFWFVELIRLSSCLHLGTAGFLTNLWIHVIYGAEPYTLSPVLYDTASATIVLFCPQKQLHAISEEVFLLIW